MGNGPISRKCNQSPAAARVLRSASMAGLGSGCRSGGPRTKGGRVPPPEPRDCHGRVDTGRPVECVRVESLLIGRPCPPGACRDLSTFAGKPAGRQHPGGLSCGLEPRAAVPTAELGGGAAEERRRAAAEAALAELGELAAQRGLLRQARASERGRERPKGRKARS